MADKKPGRMQQDAQEFADKIVEAIEAGRAPWQKEWEPGPMRAPFNPVSGTIYKGSNHVRLIMDGGYTDPRWMTFRQANEKGYRIKKGERAQRITFYSPARYEDKVDDQGNPVLGTNGKPEKEMVDLPIFKTGCVFNASQINGIEEFVPETPAWSPVEQAEKILANSGADITHTQRDRAFYRPSTDRIELPSKSQFPTPEAYYATAVHELAHWTKQPGRVERPSGPKGTQEYAIEELRAEIASWMINTEIGLGHNPSNHLAYAAGWAKAIKDDPKVIFRACRDAERIKDFIMGFAHEKVAEKTSEQNVSISPERAKELLRVSLPSGRTEQPTPAEDKLIRKIWDKLPGNTSQESVLYGIQQRRISPEGELLPPGQINQPRAQWLLELNEQARSPEHWWHYVPKEEQQTLQNPEAALRTLREIANGTDLTAPGNKTLENGVETKPQIAAEKTFLAVPYKERYKVKPLGAKWDAQNKSWFAPEGTDLGPLQQWIPQNKVALHPAASPQEEFAKALREAGLDLQGSLPVMDGRIHRVSAFDAKSGKHGAYVGYLDQVVPAGYIQNHKSGEKINWKYTGHALSEADKAKLQAQIAQKRTERRQRLEEQYETAAQKASYIFDQASPASQHPYLDKKQVPANDLRVSYKGDLVVPGYDADGNLKTLQFINAQGEKRFLPDGQKSACFHLIDGKKRQHVRGVENSPSG